MFMRRELVAKVLNTFKNFMPIFRQNMLRDRRSHMSPRNFGEFTMRKFPVDSRAIVLRKHANTSQLSGGKMKLSDIRTNVVRHSHECLATVIRMKMKLKLHSWERRVTISRMLHYRATVPRHMFKIRPKFATLSHKCPLNDTAM